MRAESGSGADVDKKCEQGLGEQQEQCVWVQGMKGQHMTW